MTTQNEPTKKNQTLFFHVEHEFSDNGQINIKLINSTLLKNDEKIIKE